MVPPYVGIPRERIPAMEAQNICEWSLKVQLKGGKGIFPEHIHKISVCNSTSETIRGCTHGRIFLLQILSFFAADFAAYQGTDYPYSIELICVLFAGTEFSHNAIQNKTCQIPIKYNR